MTRHGITSGRWETITLCGKPLVEYEMEIDMGNWNFSGRLDWVARDAETGHIWLIDFKSRKQMQPVEADETNMQMGVYQHFLAAKGIELVGTCTWQIRAAVPAIPKTNKNGTISRSACATDWETYSQAVVNAGFSVDDYIEMKEKLQDFERFSFTYRTLTEAHAMWVEASKILHRMRAGDLPIFRAMNALNCRGCIYKDICMETLRGNDVSEIIHLSFTTTEQRQNDSESKTS
jgi:hypothetical protein